MQAKIGLNRLIGQIDSGKRANRSKTPGNSSTKSSIAKLARLAFRKLRTQKTRALHPMQLDSDKTRNGYGQGDTMTQTNTAVKIETIEEKLARLERENAELREKSTKGRTMRLKV